MRLRLTLFALGVLGVFASAIGLLHHVREMQLLMRVAGDRLRSIAVTAAAALDGDAHEDAARCLSVSCANYVRLAAYLRSVQQANGLATEVYTLIPSGAGTRFVVRTAHEASLGQSYDLRPEMRAVFERGETVVTDPYSDRHGRWLSAYAPVRDRRGRVVALLEADYRAGEIVASIAREAAVFAGGTLAFLVVIGLAASRLAGRFARPLAELAKAAEATGKGLAVPELPLHAPAEIGVLARSFDRMRAALDRKSSEERLALVGRMAATLVHDLRNGMWVITDLAEQMQGEDGSLKRREIGRRVVTRARRIEEMCQDLLDHSRGDVRLSTAPVNLHDLVEEIVGEQTSAILKSRIEVEIDVDHELAMVGDRTKLGRVLANLVRNAVEAMSGGGRLSVSATRELEGVVLAVRDTGPGLAVDVAARLFEPFVTSGKACGTGLGLCIVKSFVESHGGSIRVESRSGWGTCFHLVFPEQPSGPMLVSVQASRHGTSPADAGGLARPQEWPAAR